MKKKRNTVIAVLSIIAILAIIAFAFYFKAKEKNSDSIDDKNVKIFDELRTVRKAGDIKEACILKTNTGILMFSSGYFNDNGIQYFLVSNIEFDEYMQEKVDNLNVGDIVDIKYAGAVQESYPATYLDMVSIEKIGEASLELENKCFEAAYEVGIRR